MKATTKFDISTFESLSNTHGEMLMGGFSVSFASAAIDDSDSAEDSNNCLGANCGTYCGGYDTGSNTNACNTYNGCG